MEQHVCRTQAASTDLTSILQEGTKSSEQDMQRDKGTHDHMRETGLTVVTRRSLRALADALRQPASCTQDRQNTARQAHAGETRRWPASCGHTQATELPRARPGYALSRMALLLALSTDREMKIRGKVLSPGGTELKFVTGPRLA